ncbi:L-seryl-tRNA(Sec) selenium transferase [Brevibacterium sp.]|uniref:L-seryl-tRNA(Sec) selenium transferase n=1 Tax=Brevibacterium sp. TaxID=1701 RepID=UPI0028113F28|nr:L-seryl-tRNA(Sec) selenium transferase [Brevibacterium sp.]
MTGADPRRHIPRTDHLLSLPAVVDAGQRLTEATVRAVITQVQTAAREGSVPAAEVEDRVISALESRRPSSLNPVLNGTGIIVHTNLGRAPLSPAAQAAVAAAGGYVDVEMDLGSGKRSRRGTGARDALLRACPAAEDALVVNNGAAALLLAVTALATNTSGRIGEIIVSRGELVEIGAGFRLPDLMQTTGAALREVGTTNRTHLDDYARAISPTSGCLLKVHTSNFRVEGFTAEADISSLRALADEQGLPLIADLGSGLFVPDPALPDEPDITTALEAGADVVIVSGDKLLGGPQAGLVLGRSDAVQRIAKHPLARAMRTDKLTLAAIEATVTSPGNPVHEALHIDLDHLGDRTARVAKSVGAAVVAHDGRVGGGGAPGVPLPGWAVELPEDLAAALRLGDPAIVARSHQGRCLLDLRCIPETEDERVAAAVRAAQESVRTGRQGEHAAPHEPRT